MLEVIQYALIGYVVWSLLLAPMLAPQRPERRPARR
jgi:hypothetical protein